MNVTHNLLELSSPEDPPPVISPLDSGCMELVTMFVDLEAPLAIIGATDVAMRKYLLPGL